MIGAMPVIRAPINIEKVFFMKWSAEPENLKPLYFLIKGAQFIGYFFWVLKADRLVYSDQYETLDQAMEVAFKKYSVPKSSWKNFESAFPERTPIDKGNFKDLSFPDCDVEKIEFSFFALVGIFKIHIFADIGNDRVVVNGVFDFPRINIFIIFGYLRN